MEDSRCDTPENVHDRNHPQVSHNMDLGVQLRDELMPQLRTKNVCDGNYPEFISEDSDDIQIALQQKEEPMVLHAVKRAMVCQSVAPGFNTGCSDSNGSRVSANANLSPHADMDVSVNTFMSLGEWLYITNPGLSLVHMLNLLQICCFIQNKELK